MTERSSYYVWGKVNDGDASLRLTQQHFLCTQLFGWLLHPRITALWHVQQPQERKRIVDVACGNAIWTMEVANSTIGVNADVIGLDIKSDLFPEEDWTPPNVKLGLWNIFEPPPKEYEESFDVVNIRLVFGAVSDGDPRPVLRNLMKLLKPGGSLQWLEYDFDNPVVAKESAWNQMQDMFRKSRGHHSNQWVASLGDICREEGLEQVEMIRALPQKSMLKFWKDLWYCSVKELVQGVRHPEVDALWKEFDKETTALGYVPIQTPIILVVAQKNQ
ncbi:hypothetical protein ACHAPJ_008504 [Fusarium lateritium]